MGDDSPAPPPAPVIIQPPPSQQQTAKDAAEGSAQGLEYLVNSGVLPKYAQQLTDIQRDQAPQMAQMSLDQQKVFGPQLVSLAMDNLKAADPTGFAIRQQLGDSIKSNLALGGNLSPEEQRQASQDVRAAQSARGLGTGLSDAIDETNYLTGQRFNRAEQRQSDAASFINGSTPQAQFASLNQAGKTAPTMGAPDVSGTAQGMIPSTNALIGSAASQYGTYAGAMGQLNNYGLGVANYNQQYSSNPFLTGIGVASGIAGNVLGGMGCWVADELYGKAAEKTHRVRAFVRAHLGEDSAFGEFCREYLRKGIQWAEDIKSDLKKRAECLRLWDEMNDIALTEGY